MMGKTHLVVGSTLGAGFVGTIYWLSHNQALKSWELSANSPLNFGGIFPLSTWSHDLLNYVISWANSFWAWMFPLSSPEQWRWLAPLTIALFLFGSLLPDIDNKNSMLGRYNPIPLGPHRGITHSDWFALGFLLLSFIPPLRPVFFLFLGVFIHLELDGWSMAGRDRIFPLGSWKEIKQGDHSAIVVNHPRPINYKVGSVSELVFAAVFIVIGLFGVWLGVSSL